MTDWRNLLIDKFGKVLNRNGKIEDMERDCCMWMIDKMGVKIKK